MITGTKIISLDIDGGEVSFAYEGDGFVTVVCDSGSSIEMSVDDFIELAEAMLSLVGYED